MDRRSFLLLGAGAAVGGGWLAMRALEDQPTAPGSSASTTSTSSTSSTSTSSASARPAPASYGELQAADSNGIQLPREFTSRVVARSGANVAGTTHVWHPNPDGGACFGAPEGGWVYVSNSESIFGGVGALRFDAKGEVADAYEILSGTTANCAGGPTPWHTWLSCEEHDQGQVWECDPLGVRKGVARSGMGRFRHEAAACDSRGKQVYLTEDAPKGKLRRFRPTAWGDLSDGTLEAAVVHGSTVTWTTTLTDGTPFNGGEGAWYGDGHVWFTTKGDNRVWELDVQATPNTIRVLYDVATSPTPVLSGVDNIVGTPNGDLYVAEDGGNMELVRIAATGEVAPFLRVLGQEASEITGPAFGPDGSRLYFSSQRGPHDGGVGITYEVRGPFGS